MEWNESRIGELVRMWREGLSASQVAQRLGGVSRSAVIGKVHRLGIAGRGVPSRPRSLGGRPRSAAKPTASGGPRSSASRAPRAAPPPAQAFDVPATATILTLTEHGCRWPIGDPGQAGFGFCGRQRAGGSYCQGHGPMALRRREGSAKRREIDRIVGRYVEGPQWASQDAVREDSREAGLAVGAG
jgi:GcrA cell cycle regulator